jgi:beta-lactamase superfamily II metal-dependent hydrolase
MRLRLSALALFLLTLPAAALGQANGKLQIHFMDVGQGDGAILISPNGETVLFDDGVMKQCDKPLAYLQQLGVTKIDYHITSHYHADHIGCAAQVLGEFPLQKTAFDRGESYHSGTYDAYVAITGSKRQAATTSTTITLDQGSASPVTINLVALNGNGISTDNENDKSLVAVVHFGQFDAEIGGDLSGIDTGDYKDIESSVAPHVGEVEVYKVHHHGSAYSSNKTWLDTIKPVVAIISTGDGNTYGHPTLECLDRLHAANIKRIYWTETGAGVDPDPTRDVVGGNIIVEVAPASTTFTVTYKGTSTDTYAVHGASVVPDSPDAATIKFAWSKKSKVYHFVGCRYVNSISPANLEKGALPPDGKTLHKGCPVN